MDSNFDANYYNREYFVTVNGKKFSREDGTKCSWSYANPDGEWHGCAPICGVWKNIFDLSGSSKVLDVGCGRGTFIAYLVDLGINAEGFDFSEFSISNPYSRCPKERIRRHDATMLWPYSNGSFDLTIALDIFEHLYLEDIDKVIDEMLRVSGRFIFLQIATVGGGSGSGIHDKGYVLKRGEKIPIELEGCAVAGHVTVCNKQFWIEKLLSGITRSSVGWKFMDDLVGEFVKKVPADVISNWTKNTLIIMEKQIG